jgi:hypothetical protein
LIHLAGGDLNTLARGSRGIVVVNSTSATFALAGGIPVKALGCAIYAIPGITDQRPLAQFWDALCRLTRFYMTPFAAYCIGTVWCAAGWPVNRPRRFWWPTRRIGCWRIKGRNWPPPAI